MKRLLIIILFACFCVTNIQTKHKEPLEGTLSEPAKKSYKKMKKREHEREERERHEREERERRSEEYRREQERQSRRREIATSFDEIRRNNNFDYDDNWY